MVNSTFLEDGINYISENIPTFLYNALSESKIFHKTIYDSITKGNVTNPHTVEMFIKKFFSLFNNQLAIKLNPLHNEDSGITDFLTIGVNTLNVYQSDSTLFDQFTSMLNKISISRNTFNIYDKENEFFISNSKDIQPLLSEINAISSVISEGEEYNLFNRAYSLNKTLKNASIVNIRESNITKGFLPLIYCEIIPEFNRYISKNKFSYKVKNTGLYSVEDMEGGVSILNYLNSSINISIENVFDAFYNIALNKMIHKLDKIIDINKDYIESFTLFYNAFMELDRDDIYEVVRQIKASCISTYLTFMGRLLGAKSDIIDWLYTTFVKESTDEIEQGRYPYSSSIFDKTDLTKNPDDDDHYLKINMPGENNNIDKRNFDNDVFRKKVMHGADNWNERILLKSLRLQFSAWACVINTITKISSKNTNSGRNISILNNDIPIKNYVERNESNINLARSALYSLLSAKYRTYNLEVQPHKNKKGNLIKSNDFMKLSLNRIHDPSARMNIAKDAKFDKLTENSLVYLNKLSTLSTSVTSMDRITMNIFSDLFMLTSYLILMDYSRDHIQDLVKQPDPFTGKPNTDLFEEAYGGVENKIRQTITNLFKESKKGIMNKYIRKEYDCENRYDEFKDNLKKTLRIFTSFSDKEETFSDLDDVCNLYKEKNTLMNSIIPKKTIPLAKVNYNIYPYNTNSDNCVNNGLNELSYINYNYEDSSSCEMNVNLIHLNNLFYPPFTDILRFTLLSSTTSMDVKYYKENNLKKEDEKDKAIFDFTSQQGGLFTKNRMVIDAIDKVGDTNAKNVFASFKSIESSLEDLKESVDSGDINNNSNENIYDKLNTVLLQSEDYIKDSIDTKLEDFGTAYGEDDIEELENSEKIQNVLDTEAYLFCKLILKK